MGSPRRCHIVRRPGAGEFPHHIVIFDTETKPVPQTDGSELHELWFGWACYIRRTSGANWSAPRWFRFETVAEFWAWVIQFKKNKGKLYMFSHNGTFDLPVVRAFTSLPLYGYTLKGGVMDGPPIILEWRTEGHTIKYLDTLNIWRMPLADIGKSIMHKKLEMPAPDASKEEWDRYGKQDVDVLRVALLQWFRFLRRENLGGFAPTLASQALRAFKRRFMKHQILIDDNERALQLARAGYFGARTEAFFIGQREEPFWYLDFNSMYPALMKSGTFPHRLVGVYERPTIAELLEWEQEFVVVADVTLVTDENAYPYYDGERLLFPTGVFRTVLLSPELAPALEKGHVVYSDRAVLYKHASLFADFADWVWENRMRCEREGNMPDRWRYKTFGNSLYGKYGQSGRRYEEVGTSAPDHVAAWDEWDMDDKEWIHMRAFGGVVQRFVEEEESRESFPAIAAMVTSYARRLVYDTIQQAGAENVFYTDTDSFIVNRTGFERLQHLIDPGTLGALKIEQTFTHLDIRGAKDYALDGKWKTKGIRKNAVKLAENTFVQDRFTGLKGLLRTGNLDAPRTSKVTKTLRRIYKKGVLLPGGRVRPFVLPAEAEIGRAGVDGDTVDD